MKNNFNKAYWEHKYENQKTGWDIGYISTPLKLYIDQLTNKNLQILIPGAGNSYEIEYLHKKGFTNLTVLDIAEQPLLNIKNRIPNFPSECLIQQDFFNHSKTYDLILEQTFFCALDPNLRKNYASKMNECLNKDGKIAGLLFNFELTQDGPPFGGDKETYIHLFKNIFKINTLEECYNSIKPRLGRELFFIFEKK